MQERPVGRRGAFAILERQPVALVRPDFPAGALCEAIQRIDEPVQLNPVEGDGGEGGVAAVTEE